MEGKIYSPVGRFSEEAKKYYTIVNSEYPEIKS